MDAAEADAGRDDSETASILLDLKREFRLDADHWSKWRDQAREDYALYSGDQWSKETEEALKAQNKPVVSFNRIQPTINVVSGHEISNRQEITYYPREMGDVSVSEIVTSACKWFREEADAEDEESDAFRDVLICGMGWLENRLDFNNDPDGKPACDRIDPLEMFADRYARKPNLTDAKRVWRVRTISRADAEEMFPDADPAEMNAGWATSYFGDNADGDPEQSVRQMYYEGGGNEADEETDEVTIVECHWSRREPFHRLMNPFTGQVASVAPEQYAEAIKEFTEQGVPKEAIQSVRQTRLARYRTFLGKVVLEHGPTACPKHFGYQAITGLRDQPTGTWFGLVRPMKDPQRWANKFLSQILHIVNTTAKGGVMMEAGAAEDQRDFEKSWAKADAVTYVANGALQSGRIQPKPSTPYPQGFDRLMGLSFDAIRDATGVNQEMLGLRDANQPGVLEYQRKQAGMTIIAGFFDSLRRYRKIAGEIILYIIQNDLSDGRIIRVVGKDKEQNVPLLKDQTIGDYDIIVDESPSAPNVKDRTWSMLQPLFPNLPPQVQLSLIKYSPLPESAIADITQAAQEAMQNQPPDPAVVKAQADQQTMQAKLQADQQKAQMDAAMKQADMQMERERHEMEMQAEREKLMMERQKMAMELERDQVRFRMEQERDGQRFEMERQKHQLAAHEQAKANEPRFSEISKAIAGLQEASSRKRKRTVNVIRDPATNRMISAEVVDD